MSSTREHLLGYLLGALEPADMEAVERELENNPQLRKDLATIEAALHPIGFPERDDDASLESPPPGLASRACEFVDDAKQDVVPRGLPSSVTASNVTPAKVTPAKVAAAMSQDAGSGGRRVRWADAVVVASVALAAVALLFPAIWSSRQQAQVTACQNNLRQIGVALAEYAGRSPDGRIPAVPIRGNRSTAGIYAALLQDQQLLEESQYLVCPSSDLAEHALTFRIPTLGEIDRAAGEALVRLQRTMGGSYGYNLGYVEDGQHKAPKHEGRAHYALMSDAPATFRPQRQTKNHAGCGQNILYEDNSVKWVVNVSDDLSDDPYLNRSGLVAAGLDCSDVVVAESLAKPVPTVLQPMR